MSVALKLEGFDELRAALRALPAELAGEAIAIVEKNAIDMMTEVRAVYRLHRRTGRLEGGVVVRRLSKSRFGAGIEVRSTAPHAYIVENGTQARHTSLGANRGSMPDSAPPAHVFIPAAIRHRRTMREQLKALVERKGLIVTDNG